MLRRAAMCLLFTCLCAGAAAQYARDTLSFRSDFRGTQLIAPAVLCGAGMLSLALAF